jgi:membrane-associated protein
MENILNFITQYHAFAPWIIFALLILAGLNVPISIDIMVIIAALLAANVIPDQTLTLFLCIVFGCHISALGSYWLGRLAGEKLLKQRWFQKIFHTERLAKIEKFHKKRGFATILIGRFIPFGIRNCLFMSAGMSKSSFVKFTIQDFIACSIWASTSFYLFYTLGKNFEQMVKFAKTFNILIFSAFSVTVIGVIWYKKWRKKRAEEAEKTDV